MRTELRKEDNGAFFDPGVIEGVSVDLEDAWDRGAKILRHPFCEFTQPK
jgi:hypothetical protein